MSRPADRSDARGRGRRRPDRPRPAKRFWIGLGAITARRARVARRLRDPRARPHPRSTATPPTTTGRRTSSRRASASSTRRATSSSGMKTPSAGHPPAYILYLAAVSRFIGTSELTHRLASTLLGAGAVFVIGVARPPAVRQRLGGLDRGAARRRLRAPLDQRRDAHVGEHVRAHDRGRGAGRRTGSGTARARAPRRSWASASRSPR